jgi:hypothetical protein
MLCATKINSLLFVALRTFSEVFPEDPFSKKGRRRSSLKMLHATNIEKFELV